MKNNRISWNRIDNVANLLQDGGGIYTLSPQPDSEVAFNYISNLKPSPWAKTHAVVGIYFDDGSDYLHRHHNLLVNLPSEAFHLNQVGKHNRYENDRVLKLGESVDDL
jgi:hypothetical protein